VPPEARHCVVSVAVAQAAEVPEQAPVVPHVAVLSAHSLSGSVLAGMVVHVPFVPPLFAALQAWQGLPQALLQQ
jgi:hypothetical protein